ncbi:phospholipase D-like domain-containing protein [Ramlibacter albus]|uniref:Cardiolipin synthase B n=1 Tax=Ramlibacter albus TaxID=2079448 RepID=A0A923M5B0_9BURK|nr:phospholipase D-like domain-containing protein [Ramlibacter albus]MBC5764163.1 cardiolipin synthase B [Ramlibacter albus]
MSARLMPFQHAQRPSKGAVLSTVLIAAMGIAIWSLRRQKAPKLQVECEAPICDVIPSLAGLTLSTPVPGNSVQVHENGAFFDVLIERIRAAKKSVNFETFLWKDGVLATRMADALCERARAGVAVRVMLDDTGGKKMADATRQRLRGAGVKLQFFHKRSIQNLGLLNDRDHRKLCVIDGREAFVGGHCIVDDWLGDAQDGCHFADVSIHVRGPIVHSLQGCFCDNWIGETGELFIGDDYFPKLEPAGDVLMHAAYVKPSNSASSVKVLHHSILCIAKKRLWIQNPYFIPEPEAIDAMGAAVKRGVDVRVLMPSTAGSDSPMVQRAGHRNFEKLLKCGVRLFEYPHTLLHQKVMTVDGQWCAVGSTNFDDRSFETNDEITLGILDAATAQRLDGIFEKYVARANEITLDTWNKRSPLKKIREHAFYLVNELL